MSEHRGSIRHKADGNVLFQFRDEPRGAMKADLIDISFKGMGIFSDKPVDGGTLVDFCVSGGLFEKDLKGEGRVKYSLEHIRNGLAGYRIGLEYTAVDLSHIKGIIARL
jgi:hypothetical protein